MKMLKKPTMNLKKYSQQNLTRIYQLLDSKINTNQTHG